MSLDIDSSSRCYDHISCNFYQIYTLSAIVFSNRGIALRQFYDEGGVLTAPEKEIQGVFPNSQLDLAAFYEPLVDMKEWL